MKEPVWIDELDALALHDRLLALHGGAAGLRDVGLLKSALARPQQHFAYAESPDIIDLGAVYTAGVVGNHPFKKHAQNGSRPRRPGEPFLRSMVARDSALCAFVDGNKRTGFVVGILFLELNGYRFAASEEDAARAVLELAAGNLDETGYGAFLRGNTKRSKKQR